MGRPVARSTATALLLALLAGPLHAEARTARARVAPAAPAGHALDFAPARAWPAPAEPVGPPPLAAVGVLPGEFEKQQAILLGCDQMVDELPNLFADLVLHLRGRTQVLALVHGHKGREKARRVLADHLITAPHVHYINLRHNSMWTRDFGPLTVRQPDGRWALIDAWYSCPDREDDDRVPSLLARTLRMPLVEGPVWLDGGNLLPNGRGLVLATFDLADRNVFPGAHVDAVQSTLATLYGVREVVLLEPLAGEPTAHVDMFATFTSPDTVVVASIDPMLDAENADILNRNAARLAEVVVGRRKMRVVRVPMPAHGDDVWRTYTNVVYANGLVLVPVYPKTDEAGSALAVRTFKALLPAWQVEPIDAEELAALGGALHCVTMNLGGVDRLPRWEDDEPLRRASKQSSSDVLELLREKNMDPFAN